MLYTNAMVKAVGGSKEEYVPGGAEGTADAAKAACRRLAYQGITDPTPRQIVEEMRNGT
jgi:hypothetical protein